MRQREWRISENRNGVYLTYMSSGSVGKQHSQQAATEISAEPKEHHFLSLRCNTKNKTQSLSRHMLNER